MTNKLIIFVRFLISAVLFSIVVSSDIDADYENNSKNEIGNNSDWDVLVFTQQWPATTCYHWLEEDKRHNCTLPDVKEFWTIHGIWPSQYGKFGPNFCNKSARFDITKLNPIIDDMKLYWPDVEKTKDISSLWSHEWTKHGTCAISVLELSDELKYFEKGIIWRNKFLLSDILGNAGIHPDSTNTVTSIQNALRKALTHNPSIHCLYDRKNDISYLSEIRLCFNRTLDLMDCDGVQGAQVSIDYPGGKVLTNCHISKPVLYPSIVPPVSTTWRSFPFVNVYKLLNFIMWFTL